MTPTVDASDRAEQYGVYLELNYESMTRKNLMRPEFWEMLTPGSMKIYGIDAHSTQELIEGMKNYRCYL